MFRNVPIAALSIAVLLIVGALLLWPATPSKAAPASATLSTNLLYECLPDNSLRVVFRWASTGDGPQWVDVSAAADGFESGFYSSGALPAGDSVFAWNGLATNTLYHVRVNTLTAEGWAPSPPMIFFTPLSCPFEGTPGPVYPNPVGCATNAAWLTGCVWTPKGDYASYALGERVDYCYSLNRPADVRIVATKPDGTSLTVVDGYVSGPAACIGPYSGGEPVGLRSVSLYETSSNLLLGETHFYVR